MDAVYDWAHSIIKDGNVYKMWWVRQAPYDTVWYAESTDLKNWRNERRVIQITKDTEWVKMHVGNPDVIKIGGKYYMYFEAPATLDTQNNSEYDNNVFLATSADGISWTMYPSNDNPQPIVKQPESSMHKGKYGVGQPSITYKDNQFVLFYTDALDTDGVRMATSSDGIHFGSYDSHPRVFDRSTVGVKYNSMTGKFMMAYTLNPNDFDKSKARNSVVYIMESKDGKTWDYSTKQEAWKSTYIASSDAAKVRNYGDFVTNAGGVIDTYTTYVVFTEGDMYDQGTDWRSTASTWDGHIVALNLKEFGKKPIDLPNGTVNSAANIKAYADANVTWGKLSSSAKYGTPNIDGTMDDLWNGAPVLQIARQVSTFGSLPTSVRGTARVLWDENYIYLYAEIKDPKVSYSYPIALPEEMWHRDSVDFYIDVPNDDTQPQQTYTPKQYMFSVCANGDYVVKDYHENDFTDEFDKKVRVRTTGDGYVIEAKLSWNSLVKPLVAANKTIGLDIQINDDPGTGDRASMVEWNDYTANSFRYRSNLGDLTLTK